MNGTPDRLSIIGWVIYSGQIPMKINFKTVFIPIYSFQTQHGKQ